MSELDSLLSEMAAKAEKASPVNEGDYCDEEGFLCCAKCRTRKETIIDLPWGRRKVHCLCRCEVEKRDMEEAKYKRQREVEALNLRKENCFRHKEQWQHRFENDDGKQPKMDIIRDYCIRWSEMRDKRKGLLLMGGTGTGKTFAAECVANRLCEAGVPARMISLPEALNGLFAAHDKNGYIRELTEYPLLIIDDFSLERSSEYSMENTFNLIDSRYSSGKPLIVTTNLSFNELRDCKGQMAQRMCNRLLEMCIPVTFTGRDRRNEAVEDNIVLFSRPAG